MNFFVLERHTKGEQSEFGTEFVPVNSSKTSDVAVRCGTCGAVIAPLDWLPPHREELELWGKGFGDLGFGPGDTILVSEHFRAAFESEGLIGLSDFAPVEIVKVKRIGRAQGDPPHYFLAKFARSRAAIDRAASGLECDPPCPVCPECRTGGIIHRVARIVIEGNTWSGEDIFVARGLPGTILVTERFGQFCSKHAIKNAVLIPAEDYHFDFYPWEKRNVGK